MLPTWAAACRELPPGSLEVRLWANDGDDYSLVEELEWGATPVLRERSATNIGFAAAANALADQARGDWLCLLNPDISVETQTFSDLVAWTGSHPGTLGAIPMRTGGLVHAGISVGTLLYFRDRPMGGPGPLVGPSGGAGLIPTAVWRQAGGLWEDYFAWGEDADLALRLWSNGWRTEAVPVAPLVHLGGHSVPDLAGQRRKARLLARNRLLVWARLVDGRLAICLAPFWGLGAIAICAVHVREGTARATAAGFLDGMRGWRRARRTLPADRRLGPADWWRMRRPR